jgi:hypothetical protein
MATDLPPAVNGHEQRLDALIVGQAAVLDELRALRGALQPPVPERADGTVDLREPDAARPSRKAKGGR